MGRRYQAVKKHQQMTDAPAEPQDEPTLSPRLGFVVQFRVGVGQEPEYFAGRVEHMVSGQTARFQSPEELTAFLRRMLHATRISTS